MSKFKIHLFASLLVFALTFSSCEDFFEEDLSKKKVLTFSPINNLVTTTFNQNFWWKDIKGASDYQLQIAKPNFINTSQLVLDTTITGTSFLFTLEPGFYQWRIRAKNNSSYTEFTTNTITIDTTQNLSQQNIQLFLPSDNKYSNSFQQSFSWQAMPFATSYRFEILDSISQILFSNSITTNSTSYTFATEGVFTWRVSGQNDVSPSPFSSRKITIDTTPPLLPDLLLPLNNDSVAAPVLLTWQHQSGVTLDSVFIYADSNLSQLLESYAATAQQYEYSNGLAGQDYFWRIKSRDAAGNWGNYTNSRKFIITP